MRIILSAIAQIFSPLGLIGPFILHGEIRWSRRDSSSLCSLSGCFDYQYWRYLFWSDSTIALSWIKGDPSRWHTFVSNQVTEIQQLTPWEKWDHVKTDENPADLILRGADLNQLMDACIWWNGPDWLQKDEHSWPHEHRRSLFKREIFQCWEDVHFGIDFVESPLIVWGSRKMHSEKLRDSY